MYLNFVNKSLHDKINETCNQVEKSQWPMQEQFQQQNNVFYVQRINK